MAVKQRIDLLIARYRKDIAVLVREHQYGGLCHGQGLLVEFNERSERRGYPLEPDHVVNIASVVYLTRHARKIGHKVWKTFLRARYASKPGQAPAICLYSPAPGAVVCEVIILDLDGTKWSKLKQI